MLTRRTDLALEARELLGNAVELEGVESSETWERGFRLTTVRVTNSAGAEALGKPIGSDEANGKTTYVTLAGAVECGRAVLRYTQEAKTALRSGAWPSDTGFLCALADALTIRES